jgi:hypothetical protein
MKEAIILILKATSLKVSSKDVYGDSPLHLAARNFHITCLRIMLFHEEDSDKATKYLNLSNKKGETPFSIVFGVIAKYLENHKNKHGNSRYSLNDNDVLKFIDHGEVVADFIVEDFNRENTKKNHDIKKMETHGFNIWKNPKQKID